MKNKTSFNIAISLVIFATLIRITAPYPIANFSPINAIALFCGAYFTRHSMAILIALLSVWLGDLILDKVLMGQWMLFYPGFYWQYGSYILITLLGARLINNIKPSSLLITCFSSSILFFIISNFGVWCSGSLYPLNLQGLLACYVAAIPFFKNTILSDLFFTVMLFSIMECFAFKKLSFHNN